MNGNVLVITNNFQSSLTYTRMLAGYGYAVNDVTTITDAKVHLRAGMIPAIIIMDMKNHVPEQIEFIDFLSEQYSNIQVIHVGIEHLNSTYDMIYMQRPVQPEHILNTITQLN